MVTAKPRPGPDPEQAYAADQLAPRRVNLFPNPAALFAGPDHHLGAVEGAAGTRRNAITRANADAIIARPRSIYCARLGAAFFDRGEQIGHHLRARFRAEVALAMLAQTDGTGPAAAGSRFPITSMVWTLACSALAIFVFM